LEPRVMEMIEAGQNNLSQLAEAAGLGQNRDISV
jgi:hypothetical protein